MKILFQGDSITDAGRSRENDHLLGSGYPAMVAGELAADYPGRVECVNRAVSGNRVVDLYARWKIDGVNLAPDVVSILIGVNDVWHELSHQNGVEADRFEKVYDMLLAYTREKLPGAHLVVLEPFVLKSTATEEKWDYFGGEVRLRAQAAARVAQRHGAAFVPLQKAFDEACEKAPAAWWLRDGVHPTPAGHMLIARLWTRAFRQTGWLCD